MMLQVGDVVRLKSGGPRMTIVEIGANGRAVCVWQGGEQAFPLVALVKKLEEIKPPVSEREYDWDELTTQKEKGT